MIFEIQSSLNGQPIGDVETYGSFRELASDLIVSCDGDYRREVYGWAESATDGATLVMMNGTIREVWTAKQA